jgi:RNA polymerase sigma-32 factor
VTGPPRQKPPTANQAPSPSATPEIIDAEFEVEDDEDDEELNPDQDGLVGVCEEFDLTQEPPSAELVSHLEDEDHDGEQEDRRDDRVVNQPRPARVAGSRSLAIRDPLQAYINEARRYPLLTPDEEQALATRYRETGDLDAARRLVTANLRLVVKIAYEYRKAYQNLLDLVQEGNIGLMHAVRKFDPTRGVKLSSYSAWWIRAYILKFVLNNWRLVKIGTTHAQRKLFFNLRKEVERLRRLGVETPSPRLLAENLSVPVHEVETMQKRLSARDLSLDAPIRDEDDRSLSRLDLISSDAETPANAVERAEFSTLLQRKVTEFSKALSGRDREIFELRTIAEEPLTLQEIGDRYGITRERARQLERRIMNRLRDYLAQEMGDTVHVALGHEPDET